MKNIFKYLAPTILVVSIITLVSFKPSYSTMKARMRVNRTAGLTLSTSWQKIDFSGTSIYNVNTFQLDPAGSGNPMVWWDTTNKLFKVYNTTDENYLLTFYYQTTTTSLLTASSFRLRLTVPNGVSPGVDLHTPFPDGVGYEDLATVNGFTQLNRSHSFGTYVSQPVRTNGFYVEVEISTAIALGSCTLDNTALLIQANAPTN